ncbi:MAG TPA: nucleoside monophosphate kinase [Candidatus Saccharimonadales bacterium]|nr:nucleoside monophosphate kinase [Candidatus Saccharimonadales bacterium]
MKVLIFGIQGSGKGTIGNYIAEKLEVPFIAMGDILRELREEDSEMGRTVKDYIDQGRFLPDEPTMKIINTRLDAKDCGKGFVLDGVPRNLEQNKLFTHQPDLLVLVELEEQEAKRRLLTRARHDDTEEKIQRRQDWHKENTVPLIEHYKKQGIKTIEIDNSGSVEEVRKNIDEQFKN